MRASSYYARLRPAHCRSVRVGRRLANTPYPPYAADMRKKTDVYIYTFIHPRPLERIVREQDISHSRADTPSSCTRDHTVSCKLYSWGHPTQHTRTSHVHCHSIPNTLSNNAQRPHSLKLARSTRPQTRRRNWPHLPLLAALSR